VKQILFLVLLLSSSITYSNTITINQILSPVVHDDVFLVLGSDAQVYEIDKSQTEVINQAKSLLNLKMKLN
jgi:hypothetical protein